MGCPSTRASLPEMLYATGDSFPPDAGSEQKVSDKKGVLSQEATTVINAYLVGFDCIINCFESKSISL